MRAGAVAEPWLIPAEALERHHGAPLKERDLAYLSADLSEI